MLRQPRVPDAEQFENSTRVPLLIDWPGVTGAGGEIADIVPNLDTFASVLAMAGVAIPPDVKQHGVDITPLLRGQSLPNRDLYGQYDVMRDAEEGNNLYNAPDAREVQRGQLQAKPTA
jgi:arylsulfatase A-like enzyme